MACSPSSLVRSARGQSRLDSTPSAAHTRQYLTASTAVTTDHRPARPVAVVFAKPLICRAATMASTTQRLHKPRARRPNGDNLTQGGRASSGWARHQGRNKHQRGGGWENDTSHSPFIPHNVAACVSRAPPNQSRRGGLISGPQASLDGWMEAPEAGRVSLITVA